MNKNNYDITQVRTTPQVQQHAATQQHIHQQRAAWTQLILQQLGCKTQQQVCTYST